MTDTEFQAVLDLSNIRRLRAILEELDPSVGPVIDDNEHASMRRTARAWESKLVEAIDIRKARVDRGKSRKAVEPNGLFGMSQEAE